MRLLTARFFLASPLGGDLLGHARPDDSLEAESSLSDERHEAEDTTPE